MKKNMFFSVTLIYAHAHNLTNRFD